MIVVSIDTDSGDFFTTEMKSVPRIGETVIIRGVRFIVGNVEYTIGDRYTFPTIILKLVSKNN